MADKYRFDKNLMEFKKVTLSLWTILWKILKYFLVTASLAVVYYIIFSLFVSTDTEKKLRKSNQEYKQLYGEMLRKEQLIGDVIDGLETKDNNIYNKLFNSDAPDLDHLYQEDFLSVADSVKDDDIVEYARKKLDFLEAQKDKIEENFRQISERYKNDSVALPPLTIPLRNFQYARTGATVGEKINPFYKIPVFHGGIDLIAQQGDSIFCAADGVVKDVIHSKKGLGNVVEVDHKNGFTTRYAQMENTRVTKGQTVKRGSLLGQVGVSGNSFAPHLHYEVVKDSLHFNPVNFFFASTSPENYMGMLLMSANTGQSLD